MEQQLPRVSVVVPCHNHAKWIEGALDSIANQDYDNKQIVVVENGSTDGSSSKILSLMYDLKNTTTDFVIGRYKETNIDFALLSEPKAQGPAWARNRAIEFAHQFTDLYSFLDSDDIYEQGKLSKSIAVWMKYWRNIGVVYSDYTTVDENGIRVREFKEPFSKLRLYNDCIINCDSLISKAAFDKVGLFDEALRVCEDYDMWLRIADEFICFHIPESLVTIRTGSHSSTSTVSEALWNECRGKAFEKARKRMGAM